MILRLFRFEKGGVLTPELCIPVLSGFIEEYVHRFRTEKQPYFLSPL
jgi:hypothetical protein